MLEFSGEDFTDEELSEKFIAAFLESITPEEEQELRAAVDARVQINPLWPWLSLTGTYAIEGKTLFITYELEEEEPGTVKFNRLVDISSAVTQTTWGNLKNVHQRP